LLLVRNLYGVSIALGRVRQQQPLTNLLQSVELFSVKLVEFRVDICLVSAASDCVARGMVPLVLTLDGVLRPRNDDMLATSC
jgi:hypothetical protein